MDSIGGNAAGELKGFCDRYENLFNERRALQEDLKEAWSELQAKDLPVAGMKKILVNEKKDAAKLNLAREDEERAGSLLGVTVYVGPIVDDKSDPYKPATVTLASQRIAAIRTLETDIKGLSDDIKELSKEIGSAGFIPKLIPKIVKIRNDPASFREGNLLTTTYLTAIGVTP